jgi:hypothetical protein
MGASWLESSRYSAKSTTVASGTFSCRGTVEPTGLDAQPALHQARVGKAPRTLGDAQLFSPARRLRQLGVRADEIAAHEADQGQVDARRRDWLFRQEPHRVDLVLVYGGLVRRCRLEVGTGGSELAAQPRHHPERGVDHRPEPPPAVLEARAQQLEHLGHPRRSARTT